jgi:hypothetical protein
LGVFLDALLFLPCAFFAGAFFAALDEERTLPRELDIFRLDLDFEEERFLDDNFLEPLEDAREDALERVDEAREDRLEDAPERADDAREDARERRDDARDDATLFDRRVDVERPLDEDRAVLALRPLFVAAGRSLKYRNVCSTDGDRAAA